MRSSTSVLGLALINGCLSGGPPPAGQRLAEGRDIAAVSMLADGAGPGLLVWRLPPSPVSDPFEFDLHLVSWAAGGADARVRLLSERVRSASYGLVFVQGKLLLNQGFHLLLLDPRTGENVDLGDSAFDAASPSRDRFIYVTYTRARESHLRERDGRDLLIDQSAGGVFSGEDFYYVSGSEQRLVRIAADGASQVVATNVASVERLGSLVFTGGTDERGFQQASLFDPTTAALTPLPIATPTGVSGDQRWIAGYPLAPPDVPPGRSQYQAFLVVDRETGATQTYVTDSYVLPEWRTARAQLWSAGNATTVILEGGGATRVIGRMAADFLRGNDGSATYFTSDGAHFFAYERARSFTGSKDRLQLVSADYPEEDEGIALNPEGSELNRTYWELSASRLVVQVSYAIPERADLILIDIPSRTSRLLGEAGEVVAAGERRILARTHVTDGGGDLVLIDADTGATTKLAEGVTNVDVERHAGGDPLAPGTEVAFVLRNPIASRYDGAWVATLP